MDEGLILYKSRKSVIKDKISHISFIYFLSFSSPSFSPFLLFVFFWCFETEYTGQASLKLAAYPRLPWNSPTSWGMPPSRCFHNMNTIGKGSDSRADEGFLGAEVKKEECVNGDSGFHLEPTLKSHTLYSLTGLILFHMDYFLINLSWCKQNFGSKFFPLFFYLFFFFSGVFLRNLQWLLNKSVIPPVDSFPGANAVI